jgi:TRAP-type uncharacterized transport system substrate-binding protein
MTNVTKAQLKKVQTLEDLQNLEIGPVQAEIGHRGGGLGFYARHVAEAIGVDPEDMPRMYGAYCNYLGGGVRGAVLPSGFNTANITGRKAGLMEELANACVRVYLHTESLMHDDQEDREDWNEIATEAARKANIKSAY